MNTTAPRRCYGLGADLAQSTPGEGHEPRLIRRRVGHHTKSGDRAGGWFGRRTSPDPRWRGTRADGHSGRKHERNRREQRY
eukprot:scaffold1431_cov59-Phaeocystis_antarctica.AAC.1